jgi:hypothetical protein
MNSDTKPTISIVTLTLILILAVFTAPYFPMIKASREAKALKTKILLLETVEKIESNTAPKR